MNNDINQLPEGKYDVQILVDEKVAEKHANVNRAESIAIWRTWYADAFNSYSSDTELVLRALNRQTGRIVRIAI